jgi:hypothetical protein
MAAASASAHETTIRARMFLKARTGVTVTYIAPTFDSNELWSEENVHGQHGSSFATDHGGEEG